MFDKPKIEVPFNSARSSLFQNIGVLKVIGRVAAREIQQENRSFDGTLEVHR